MCPPLPGAWPILKRISTGPLRPNSGSYGFKSGRANFASAYSQGKAGGVYVGSTTQSMSLGGNVLATGRSLDAAIQGRGFFVARDSNGAMVYSRVGQFNVDKDGFVVDSIGRRVQGYGTASGGVLGDLSVPTEAMPAAASSTLNYAGNMSAATAAPRCVRWARPLPGPAVAPRHAPPVPAAPAASKRPARVPAAAYMPPAGRRGAIGTCRAD